MGLIQLDVLAAFDHDCADSEGCSDTCSDGHADGTAEEADSGSKPAEGWYIPAMQASSVFYFAFFLLILPILGLIETPRRLPNSITEAVLEKNKGGAGHPAGAAAAPETKG